jgi:hypothetical protein
VNRRKSTKALTHKQVPTLIHGWQHAWRIGRPLNQLVTFRPMDIDKLSEIDRCKLFEKLRNKIAGYARKRGIPPTFAWSREVAPDGVGEHLHVLVHLPAGLHGHFAQTVWKWLPERSAGGDYMTTVDVRPANQRTRFTELGKRYNAIGYLCKQMSPKAGGSMVGDRWKRHMNRVRGGAILGKRGDVTKNIGRKAIEAWKPNEMREVHAA